MPPVMFSQINVEELRGRRLGQVLVKMGQTTREKVHEALEIQREKGGPLGQILLDLGYIDESALSFALAFQAGMEYVDLETTDIPEEVIRQIPAQMANAYKVVPLEYDEADNHLVVALGSADNFRAVDDLRFRPAWKNREDLAGLTGRVVRIRFHLRNARLYAFRIGK